VLLKASWDIVKTFIQNMSGHGIRKGSATHVASATTAPPPIASIANRGDWSLGKVLDVYWQFAEAGDSYLGRCLCGLDPNDSTFSVLPPHWNVDSPVDDADIKEGLQLMYGKIIAAYPESIAVLVRFLASATYASDWLQDIAAKNPGHPFSAVPLLQNPDLLGRLKTKVTVEPTPLLSKATGVPPHVKQLSLMTALLQLCQTTLLKVSDQAEIVRQSIFDAMEERALDNGLITRNQIVDILDEFRNGIRDDVKTQLENLQGQGVGLQPQPSSNQQPQQGPTGTLFSYAGRFWDVPQDFAFPIGVKRDVGWKLWLHGMPGYSTVDETSGQVIQKPIKPFRKFLPARLPKKIADTFKLHWRPIYMMMEEGLEMNILAGATPQQSAESIDSLYNQATDHLKTRVRYIFEDKKLHHNTWTIATWSKYVGRSMIAKKGTETDKANLPEESRFNQGHTGRKRRIPRRQQARGPRRVFDEVRRPPPSNANRGGRGEDPTTEEDNEQGEEEEDAPTATNNEEGNDIQRIMLQTRRRRRGEPQAAGFNGGVNFDTAFQLTELSETAQARSRQYERLVREEVEQEWAEERGTRNETGWRSGHCGRWFSSFCPSSCWREQKRSRSRISSMARRNGRI